MDLINGTLGDNTVDLGEITLKLPYGIGKSGESLRVVVGIRPEHILIGKRSEQSGCEISLEGTVEFLENLGSEEIVHVRIGSLQLKAKYPGGLGATIGDKITIHMDTRNSHIFDAETEMRL